MIDLSRRRILLLGSLATPWLLGGIPWSSGGWLEQSFSRRASTLTSPITPNEEFYLTSYRSPPTVRTHEWSLSVRGLVERPMTLDYEQLCARPSVSHVVTLECVGNTVAGEYIGTARWEGCSLRSLLEEAGVRTDAVDVVFRAADEYSDSISLTRAMAGDVMVAFRMNGVALPQSHGFPARMIVPGHYGMKSVQWLTDIEAVDHDYKGYYARKGWTDEAIIKTTSRIDVPGHGSTLQGCVTRWPALPLPVREESLRSRSEPTRAPHGPMPRSKCRYPRHPGSFGTMTGSFHKTEAIRCQCERPTARALSSHPLSRMRHPTERPEYTKSR